MTAISSRAFTYSTAAEHRRYGPSGYSDYESFRPWLRDEFCFRCIYCLLRERWGRITGEFDLEHVIPQTVDQTLATDYSNLFYSCHSCNLKKGPASLSNAELHLTSDSIRVSFEGRQIASTAESERIVDVLALNSPKRVNWRLSWMRIIQLAAERDSELYQRLMGFPDDLPDLSRSNPPANIRPEGIDRSYFVQRERGELPDTHVS